MSTPNPLDSVRLNFSQSDLLLLNLALALIMYGVALDLKWADFRYLIKNPKGFILGVFSQFLVLPFFYLGFDIHRPTPSKCCIGNVFGGSLPRRKCFKLSHQPCKRKYCAIREFDCFFISPFHFQHPIKLCDLAGFYTPTSLLLREISLDITDVFFHCGDYFGSSIDPWNCYESEIPRICSKSFQNSQTTQYFNICGFCRISLCR